MYVLRHLGHRLKCITTSFGFRGKTGPAVWNRSSHIVHWLFISLQMMFYLSALSVFELTHSRTDEWDGLKTVTDASQTRHRQFKTNWYQTHETSVFSFSLSFSVSSWPRNESILKEMQKETVKRLVLFALS